MRAERLVGALLGAALVAGVTPGIAHAAADMETLSVTPSRYTVPVGVPTTITWTVVVQNNGPDAVTTAEAELAVVENLHFVNTGLSVPPPGTCDTPGQFAGCQIALANGESTVVTWTDEVTASLPGTIERQFLLQAPGVDGNGSNNNRNGSLEAYVGQPDVRDGLITFDNGLPDGAPLTGEYAESEGVYFARNVGVLGMAQGGWDIAASDRAVSAPNVAAAATCETELIGDPPGSSRVPSFASFDQPQRLVSVKVGSIGAATIGLRARDQNFAVLDSDSVTVQPAAGPLGATLTVSTATARITGIEIVANEGDSCLSPTALVDDLRFTAAAPPPSRPPVTGPRPRMTLPGRDADRDGVSGESDLCLFSPRRGRTFLNGCTTSELLSKPALAARPALERISDARMALRGNRPNRRYLRRATQLLNRGAKGVRKAARELNQLDICEAARVARGASRGAQAARRAAARGRRTGVKALAVKQVRSALRQLTPQADVSPLTHQQSVLVLQSKEVGPAARAIGRVAKGLRGLCARTTADHKIKGEIADLAPGGFVTLSGGKTISTAGMTHSVGPLTPGMPVTAMGPSIGGVLYAEKLKIPTPPLKPGPGSPCLELRIVPIQLGVIRPKSLPLGGYTQPNGRLLLEGGMGFGAERRPGAICTKASGAKPWRHELVLEINFGGTSWGRGYEAGEAEPDVLDSDGKSEVGNPFVPQAVHVKEVRYRCTPAGEDCGGPEQLSSATYNIDFKPAGQFGLAWAGATEFAVPDRADAFVTSKLALLSHDPAVPAPSVSAAAWVVSGGAASFPHPVFGGEQIAIPADVHPYPFTFPQIFGTRNGRPYVYSARQLTIMTDMVTRCPSGSNSYYELPWKPFDKRYIAQGAFGSFSHKGGWAWDIPMDVGTDVFAPRGGIVAQKVESRQNNFYRALALLHFPDRDPDDVTWKELQKKEKELTQKQKDALSTLAPANYLLIEHQDKSFSVTYHHPKDGVLVEEGQRVRRGQLVSKAGNTGYSTGPHLHYQVETRYWVGTEVRSATLPVYFRGLLSNGGENGKFTHQTCADPKAGEWWASTNFGP